MAQQTSKRKLEEPSTSELNVRRSKREKKTVDLTATIKEEPVTKFSNMEKLELFNGLIQHGSSNLSALQPFVPNKTEDCIKRFIYSYKRISRYSLSDGKNKSPIDEWLEFLTQDTNKDREKLQDLSRALKYIYLFEPRGDTNEEMIREGYLLLSEFMRGDQPKHLDPVTSLLLHKKINELIRIFKTQDFTQEHKHLETYQKKKPACYSGKRKVEETTTSKIDPRISNPLKVPDSLLVLKK